MGLLTGLIVGLMLLLLNFSYLIEQGILNIVIPFKTVIKKIVNMNLISHRVRNRKTIMIYSLCLAFINFINVSTSMQF